MATACPFRTSARAAAVLATLAILLAGCAGNPVLDLVGGGADLRDDREGGLTRRATGEGVEYSNLGTVPPRPAIARTPADRQALMQRLERDRAEAEAEARELERRAPQPVTPPGRGPAERPSPVLPGMTGTVPPPSGAILIPEAPRPPS